MVSWINGIDSNQNYPQTHKMHGGGSHRRDPYTKINTTGGDGVSQTELDAWLTQMSPKTGTTINASKAVKTYDADENGESNASELKSFLDANSIQGPTTAGPPSSAKMESTDASATTSAAAGSILSVYDKNSDGPLSSSEFDEYYNASKTSAMNLMGQALSAYMKGMGTSTSSNPLLNSSQFAGNTSFDFCA
jgi:Ca2+-binding EF-hand superfamily protein